MEPARERRAHEPVHHEPLHTVLRAARDVRDDRRVHDGLEGRALAPEALVGPGLANDLHRDLALRLAVERRMYEAHPALADELSELEAIPEHVARARLAHERAQSSDRAVVEHRHGSTPRTARASLRHSSSVAVISRSSSRTRRRNSRRVHAR